MVQGENLPQENKPPPTASPKESFGQEGDMHSDLRKRAIKNTYHYLLGVNRRFYPPFHRSPLDRRGNKRGWKPLISTGTNTGTERKVIRWTTKSTENKKGSELFRSLFGGEYRIRTDHLFTASEAL